MIHIFKRGNHKCRISFVQFRHRDFTLPNRTAKIRTEKKVDIKHHHKIGSGKQAGDVSPGVELTVERVYDEVHVDVVGHVRRGGVKHVEACEELVDVAGGVWNVDAY